MKYCENCYFVFDQERCPLCGNKKVRQVQEDDFCFLTEKSISHCEMLMKLLKKDNIYYSTMPYGRGIESYFGLPLENCRLYVPFSSLEKANKIMQQAEDSESEKLRNDLLENTNKLHVSENLEKKLRKKLKLSEENDLIAYCIDRIRYAHKLVDSGRITNCPNGGHYLFCFSDDVTLSVNSKTYELLSLTITKTRR